MITAVIIAKDESKNISECLKSLGFCSEILVIDNGSVDNTTALVKTLGAKVIRESHKGDFSRLRNTALKHVSTPWTLFVDADEHISLELAQEILSAIKNEKISGFLLPRLDYMWGLPLRHGDTGGIKLLRLGQTHAGSWSGKVHETWLITGKIGELIHPIYHHPHTGLADFLTRLNIYSGIRAKELYFEAKTSGLFSIVAYPLAKFFKLWIWKLGFLDKTAGLVHAMSMAFYSFLVRAKLYLLSKGIRDAEEL